MVTEQEQCYIVGGSNKIFKTAMAFLFRYFLQEDENGTITGKETRFSKF